MVIYGIRSVICWRAIHMSEKWQVLWQNLKTFWQRKKPKLRKNMIQRHLSLSKKITPDLIRCWWKYPFEPQIQYSHQCSSFHQANFMIAAKTTSRTIKPKLILISINITSFHRPYIYIKGIQNQNRWDSWVNARSAGKRLTTGSLTSYTLL